MHIGVTKRWGAHVAVDNVELLDKPEHIVRICGANGSGKTTLLRIASGLVHPDAGQVKLGGMDIEPDRRAFVNQLGFASAGDRGPYPRLSVLRHLMLGADVGFVPRADRAAAI